jgi:putative acetyltransferase
LPDSIGPSKYPAVKDHDLVGTYPAVAKAGGGYVWDNVLEYRVWCHPHDGAPDFYEGSDYYYAFDSYEKAIEYSRENPGTESPIALILQEEYIEEPEPGKYIHRKEKRVAEWPVEFLSRPKRNALTIPDFLAPNAPANRLDIIRGLA